MEGGEKMYHLFYFQPPIHAFYRTEREGEVILRFVFYWPPFCGFKKRNLFQKLNYLIYDLMPEMEKMIVTGTKI